MNNLKPFCPLEHEYKTTPYPHQLEWLENNAHIKGRALFWTMRTGKTKTMIDNAFYLHAEGEIDTVLIVAPNGVHVNWVKREIPIHAWHDNYNKQSWVSSISGKSAIKKKREYWEKLFVGNIKSEDLFFFSLNMEALIVPRVKTLIKNLVKKRRVLLIIDESHHFSKHDAKRVKFTSVFSKACKYTRILSGTPSTDSPLDIYAQFRIMDEDSVREWANFNEFKLNFAEYKSITLKDRRSFEKLIKYKNLDELNTLIHKNASVITRDQIGELSNLNKEFIEIIPTKEQKQIYDELSEELTVELDGSVIEAVYGKLMKLQQVLGGFLLDELKEVKKIPGINPKLEKLIEEIKKSEKPVVVFATFRNDFDVIQERLKKEKIKYLPYYGGVDEKIRTKFREEFCKPVTEYKVALCNPASAGEGLNMSACDTIIWYSYGFRAVTHEQANERATSTTKGNVKIKYLTCGGADDYILTMLIKKIDVEKSLLSQSKDDIINCINQLNEADHGEAASNV